MSHPRKMTYRAIIDWDFVTAKKVARRRIWEKLTWELKLKEDISVSRAWSFSRGRHGKDCGYSDPRSEARNEIGVSFVRTRARMFAILSAGCR